MEKFKNACAWLLVSTVMSLVAAFTLMWMWQWFVTPVGLPPINYLEAMGLTFCINFIFAYVFVLKQHDDIPANSFAFNMGTMVFKTGIFLYILGISFLVHRCMA